MKKAILCCKLQEFGAYCRVDIYPYFLTFFSDCVTHKMFLYLFSLVFHVTQNTFVYDFGNRLEYAILLFG